MLPPAGQIFEKWHVPDFGLVISELFATFKQGASRVLPPADQIFEKWCSFRNIERVFSTTRGSMFNYPVEYFQLPWGVFSTTLGSASNYPGEYFQLPWGVCSTTLGSMFNYLGEYVQLPWGVCSTTFLTL